MTAEQLIDKALDRETFETSQEKAKNLSLTDIELTEEEEKFCDQRLVYLIASILFEYGPEGISKKKFSKS